MVSSPSTSFIFRPLLSGRKFHGVTYPWTATESTSATVMAPRIPRARQNRAGPLFLSRVAAVVA